MNDVGIVGLGYVGLTTALCFTTLDKISIIGFEKNEDRLRKLKLGKIPFYEPGLDDLFETNKSKLSFHSDFSKLDKLPKIIFVCIGTPLDTMGSLDTTELKKSINQILDKIIEKEQNNISIVIRSTLPLGTLSNIKEKIRLKFQNFSSLKPHLIYNPEFLREGSAKSDFMNPELIVLGVENEKDSIEILKIYDFWKNKVVLCGLNEAEIIKSINNTWHALKISFANEIGSICQKLSIDEQKVFEIFKMDKKLNISSAYLNPGFSYGGSCLHKDVSSISLTAKAINLNTPVISSINLSNINHFERFKKKIIKKKINSIGIMGLAFKDKTDDFRESMRLKLALELKNHGCSISLFDRYICESILTKKYDIDDLININKVFAHFEFDIKKVIEKCDLLINFGHSDLIEKELKVIKTPPELMTII